MSIPKYVIIIATQLLQHENSYANIFKQNHFYKMATPKWQHQNGNTKIAKPK
jgi:hypothetical protein